MGRLMGGLRNLLGGMWAAVTGFFLGRQPRPGNAGLVWAAPTISELEEGESEEEFQDCVELEEVAAGGTRSPVDEAGGHADAQVRSHLAIHCQYQFHKIKKFNVTAFCFVFFKSH